MSALMFRQITSFVSHLKTYVATLNVGLVLLVAVATSRSASHDFDLFLSS